MEENTNTKKLLVFDTETTGVNARAKRKIINSYFDSTTCEKVYEYGEILAPRDEILQLSMVEMEIDKKGKILGTKEILNQYFKPEHLTSWEEAERINHISPDMVKGCPTFKEKLNDVLTILKSYKGVVGQNLNFDMRMVGVAIQEAALSLNLNEDSEEYKYGVAVEQNKSHVIFDTMHEFSNLRKEPGRFGSYACFKLIQETEYYPESDLNDFIELKIPSESEIFKNGKIDFHNSLTDVYMTGYVLGELFQENKNLVYRLNTLDLTDSKTANHQYGYNITPSKAKEICKSQDIDFIRKKMLNYKFPVTDDYLVFTNIEMNDDNTLQADMISLSDYGNPKAPIIRVEPFVPSDTSMFDLENKKIVYQYKGKELE